MDKWFNIDRTNDGFKITQTKLLSHKQVEGRDTLVHASDIFVLRNSAKRNFLFLEVAQKFCIYVIMLKNPFPFSSSRSYHISRTIYINLLC